MFPDMCEDESMRDEEVSPNELTFPQLTCLGRINQCDNVFHPNGFVGSCEFESLLCERDPCHALYSEEEISLFGKGFLFDEAFLTDSELLVTLMRTLYERLELAARGNQVHSHGTPPKIIRQQLNELLTYFRVYTYRFLSFVGRDEELPTIYEKLTKVVQQADLFMTSISNMPSIIFSGGSLNNDAPIAVFFHCYFNLRWSMIEMAYMAAHLRKYNENCRKSREKFAELLPQLQGDLCGDLLYLALRRFPDLNPKNWTGSSPFNCTCVRELWYMLLTTLAKTEPSGVFLFILKRFQSLQEAPLLTFCPTFLETRKLQLPSKDPLALVWLLVHLAKLSGFSLTGVWDKDYSRMEPNYDVINKLVQQYFTGTDGAVNEERTGGLMGMLYSLSHLWGSNLNLCILLWEQFSRKMDEPFTSPSPFEPQPYSSSIGWFEQITANVEPWKNLSGRQNSYFLFLRLLGYHLEQMNSKSQSSLKARLYVKLQGKKFLELSPIGLYHMLSACLTVTLTSESSDMSAKILELSENHKQGLMFFVAEMVLLLISVTRGRDCQDVATSVAAKLDRASKSLNDAELTTREEQRKYGSVFVEGFQEILFHSRNFSLGQVKLIDKTFRNYLKNCGSCDRAALVDAISNMLKKIGNNPAVCDEMYNAVMTHVFPLMKEKFAAVEHVSFFVELTTAAMEANRPEFQTIFTFFCLDEKVNPRLSVKYLAQLLDKKQFPVSLSLVLDNYQAVLIQSWFRISFLLPMNGELKGDIERVGTFVRRLPRMAELAIQCKLQFSCSAMILEFLQMISANHQNIQSFSERAAVRELYLQYIGPLDKYLTSVNGIATVWEPADQVAHVLRLGGYLFFHCGNIIYTKGKADCLLALLNNILLIPLNFSDLSKDLPTTVVSALHQQLPTYVFGLFRLNPLRDPYILRCLNSVFQIYMTRFTPNTTHPFTRCWTGLESEPVTEALVPHVRNWFVQTVCNSVLPQKTAKTSPYLQPTLQWLKLLTTNKEWKMEIMRPILLPILELSLIMDEVNCKRSVADFLQSAVCASDEEQMATAEQALNELVGRHMAFNSNRLFKLVETVSILNADLVRRILPNIRNHVVITEAKRGTGVDSVLRQHLGTLEMALGVRTD